MPSQVPTRGRITGSEVSLDVHPLGWAQAGRDQEGIASRGRSLGLVMDRHNSLHTFIHSLYVDELVNAR